MHMCSKVILISIVHLHTHVYYSNDNIHLSHRFEDVNIIFIILLRSVMTARGLKIMLEHRSLQYMIILEILDNCFQVLQSKRVWGKNNNVSAAAAFKSGSKREVIKVDRDADSKPAPCELFIPVLSFLGARQTPLYMWLFCCSK